MRLLTALQRDGEQSMGELATGLGVTPRRVTVLVEALEADGLVERRPHPTDRRSTLVAITDGGLKAQQVGWEQHRAEVAQMPSATCPCPKQAQLLAISRTLTQAMRTRLAGRPSPQQTGCEPISRPRSS